MSSRLRPLVETVAVFGLLGWLYVAAVAAARPQDLWWHIASVVPLRRDTFGTLCFVLSGAAVFALQLRSGRLWTRGPRRREPLDAALRTVGGYALLGWIYLCVNSLTHPETIPRRLVHFTALPTEGTAADVGFAAAAACFLALRLRGRAGEGGAGHG